jgi:putative aminopeptidase FrvX
VPSTVVSVPCRYIHSPHCLVDKGDIEQTARLVRRALDRLTPEVLS